MDTRRNGTACECTARWKWIALYLALGAAIYLLVYFVAFTSGNGGY